jgi:hypothetical protein
VEPPACGPSSAPPAISSRPRPAPVLPLVALALALLCALWPWLALPASMVLLLVTVRATAGGGLRWAVAVVGGVAAAVGLYRFTIEWAVPNIVSSGQFAAEERAVSRLREILWAEDRTLERAFADGDADGTGEYAFLGELLGLPPQRPGVRLPMALLRTEQFHPASDGLTPVYRSEGYDFVVYLPGPGGGGVGEGRGAVDPRAAARHFVAYAWPAERGKGGLRAFYIDQDDRICQTDNAQGYSGTGHIPAPAAALAGTGLDAPACGPQTVDGGRWRPWKNKKPRIPRG